MAATSPLFSAIKPGATSKGLLALCCFLSLSCSLAAAPPSVEEFEKSILPVIDDYCMTCHAGASPKGGIAFDREDTSALINDHKLWLKSLRMIRAEMMPPVGKDRPSPEQLAQLESWIKNRVFQIDPRNPDPGRVTLRRLNRIEYRNTVKDLIGVDYNTEVLFPPDDTGHGFDTISEVLSLSPLLLEKYITAARSIVAEVVPTTSKVVAEKHIPGRQFQSVTTKDGERGSFAGQMLSYYTPAHVKHNFTIEYDGKYQVVLDLTASERYVDGVFDYNKCKLIFKIDGQVAHEGEYVRQGGKKYLYTFDREWSAGQHELSLELQPLAPAQKQVRSLSIRLNEVVIRGPLDPKFWVPPANYAKYFPRPVPADEAGRRQYARELLQPFASKAYRRPVDAATLDRLVDLAIAHSQGNDRTFESGIAQAMTVVLASPRFVFREEQVEPAAKGSHPRIDEFSLASRLSYFLWSTMPDEELFRLAREKKLRANLKSQVARMIADPRSQEFVRHFVGQWLQARSIDNVQINTFAVLSRDEQLDPKVQKQRARFRELARKPPESLTEAEKKEFEAARAAFRGGFRRFAQFELDGELRRAMRQETEMLFDHILKNDRSLLEMLDSDYTFLNERLAKHYGIEGVNGPQMRKVKLPENSPRGGIITQGTVLAVTSNPDRTSPVKRGLFILENILGTPPPPAPPDIPALEEAGQGKAERPKTLREQLELHRDQPLCRSCHNRMDPLGLALENFNALGLWRDTEQGQPVNATGELITGEPFQTVQQMKKILVQERRLDFYRCLTEKLMMYALGRGIEYYDTHTIDEIVARLEKSNGKPSELLAGLIESAPFQKRRAESAAAVKSTTPPSRDSDDVPE